MLPTQKHKLKDLPPWGVLASILDQTEQEDEAKKFINGDQKSSALPIGMQHDKEKERATWLHTNPEQNRITKALMRVIRCETEKNDMNDDKGYVKLWDVVEKTKTLHGLNGNKVVQAALKSQGRWGCRFKLKEKAPGVFLIKTRNKEKQKQKKTQDSRSSFAERFEARGKGA